MFLTLLVALVLFSLAFGVMEHAAPAIPRHRSLREGRADLAWFFANEAVRQSAHWLTVGIAAVAAAVLGLSIARSGYIGHGPLGRLPMAVQAVLAILIVDGMGYAIHRVTHRVPLLWRAHGLHHTPTHLDWLAGNRVHPLDTWITRPIRLLPVILVGLHPRAAVATAPFFAFWNLFVHANVPWRLGPLRYVVSTPAFHRWHHARDVPACNFAPLLPLWDILGGTFYLPDHLPEATGVAGLDVPDDGWWAQLWSPFRDLGWSEHAMPPASPTPPDPTLREASTT